MEESASTGFFGLIFYDTMVFLAISIRLLLDNPADGWIAKAKVFISTEKMGYLSQALLQTGQVYYLYISGRVDSSYPLLEFTRVDGPGMCC